MSKLLISALLCLIFASCVYTQDVKLQDLMAYQKWRFNNKRVYLNDEEQVYRQAVFFDNLKLVQEHANNKEATYTVGLNQFSDWSSEEFKSKILNKNRSTKRSYLVYDPYTNTYYESTTNYDPYNPYGPYDPYYPNPTPTPTPTPTPKPNPTPNPYPNPTPTPKPSNDPMVSNKALPKALPSVDWRTKGVLSPIKNQGECGSCWTFSVIGGIEAFYALTNKKIEQFSEQLLVDCANDTPQSDGCNGGFQVDGIRWAIKNGVVRGSQYPYVGSKGRCRVSVPIKQGQGFFPKKYQQVPSTSEGLKQALSYSPVIATVNADSWQSYNGGVFNGCPSNIGMDQLNHAIVAVGYDAKGNWIIRNTWGANWGENGYIRLAAGNSCGILVDNQIITE